MVTQGTKERPVRLYGMSKAPIYVLCDYEEIPESNEKERQAQELDIIHFLKMRAIDSTDSTELFERYCTERVITPEWFLSVCAEYFTEVLSHFVMPKEDRTEFFIVTLHSDLYRGLQKVPAYINPFACMWKAIMAVTIESIRDVFKFDVTTAEFKEWFSSEMQKNNEMLNQAVLRYARGVKTIPYQGERDINREQSIQKDRERITNQYKQNRFKIVKELRERSLYLKANMYREVFKEVDLLVNKGDLISRKRELAPL